MKKATASYELKVPPQTLVFGDNPPNKSGRLSPYRRAIEELMTGVHGAGGARFKDTPQARKGIKKWADALGAKIEWATEGEYLWIRLAQRRAKDTERVADLTAAVLQAIRELPRTQAEIASRVMKELWVNATSSEVSKELQRLIAAGTIHKTDDLKHVFTGGRRG